MKIIDSDIYTSVIFIATISVSLLIMFSIFYILSTNQEKIYEEVSRDYYLSITGFSVSENNGTDDGSDKGNIYSVQSYFIYFLIFMSLTVLIFYLTLRLILPAIKDKT